MSQIIYEDEWVSGHLPRVVNNTGIVERACAYIIAYYEQILST